MSHSRPGALLGERSKQLFPAAVIPVSNVWGMKGTQLQDESPCKDNYQIDNHAFDKYIKMFTQARHYQTPGFSSASADHGQFSGGQAVHEPYGVAQAQHPSTYGGPSVPVSFASSSQIRGKRHLCTYISRNLIMILLCLRQMLPQSEWG